MTAISDALTSYVTDVNRRFMLAPHRCQGIANVMDIKPFQPPVGSPNAPTGPFASVEVGDIDLPHIRGSATADALTHVPWVLILAAENTTGMRSSMEEYSSCLLGALYNAWHRPSGSRVIIRGSTLRARRYGRRRERGDVWQGIYRLESEVWGLF